MIRSASISDREKAVSPAYYVGNADGTWDVYQGVEWIAHNGGTSTGNASQTWGAISLTDMFTSWDAEKAWSSYTSDYYTVSIETGSTQGAGSDSKACTNIAATVPQYGSDATGEWLTRDDVGVATKKLARVNTSHAAPNHSLVLSSYKTDHTAQCREEIITFGTNVDLPQGVDLWVAGRVYLDFSATQNNEWVSIWQLKPDPSRFPPLTVTFGSNVAHGFSVWTVWTYNTTDHLSTSYVPTEGVDKHTIYYSDAASWLGKWFDFTVHLNFDPNNTGTGYFSVYFDDTLIASYTGPIGFPGIADGGYTNYAGKTVCINNPRWSNYPQGNTPWTGGVRNVEWTRGFVCRDKGPYTRAQIRAALVA